MVALTLPNERVLRHVVDVHCHPTDASQISHETMEGLNITLCAMATTQSDQQRVRDLALQYPDKVIPCFGQLPFSRLHRRLNPIPRPSSMVLPCYRNEAFCIQA